LAFEGVDVGESVFECGVAVVFAGVGCVEGLFLGGQCGLEAELVVVGGEPGVEDECGEEECAAEGDDFDCAAGCHRLMWLGAVEEGLFVLCW
jgi:hypothetical protein